MTIKQPNILYLDIETSLMKVYTFSLWPESISIDDVIQDWSILCIGYAWNDEPAKVLTGSERSIVKKASALLNKADILVYHNGDRFDLKRIKTKIAQYGLPPVKKFSSNNTVDTYKVAKKEFNFSSNKLNYITRNILKIGEKIATNKQLWISATEGSKKALAQMATYCVQDVEILRKLYKKLVPYITNHPNMGHFSSHNRVCTNCGSTNIKKKGYNYSRLGKFQVWFCNACGAQSQGKENLRSVQNK